MNEIGWSSYSEQSNSDILIVSLPHTPDIGPVRDSSGSSLTQIMMTMSLITGEKAGGLNIVSYGLETSQD